MAFLPRFWRNRSRDSCPKRATGTGKTGIRRIPAGIGNLAGATISFSQRAPHAKYLMTCLLRAKQHDI
jgi:hypothetical protein